MKNQLRIGVYLSYVNLAISCLIPFLYTPIMLDMLGQAEYGLYSLAHSVVGYLSLLSFGFGSTIIRYLSKYRAENKTADLEQTYGFFLILYSVLAIAVFIGGLVLSGYINVIFDRGLTLEEIKKVQTLVIIMALSTALSFPLSVFASVAIAHERYLFRRIMDIVSTLTIPIANLIVLLLGYASVGMALVGTVIPVLLAPISIAYCFQAIQIKPRFTKLPWALIREMINFSVFVFLGSLVDMLFWATDKVILGMLVSSTAVAVYNVGGTFNNMVMSLSTSISGVLVPRITGMVATDKSRKTWTELFVKVGRVQFLIIGLIVSGFTVFGQTFINLWAGPEYADSFWVAVLTMFPLCIPLIQNTGLSFLVAQNKHQFRAIVYLVIAIANIISTYLVVPPLGIIGAALCSCISYLLGQGLIMNIYYYKVTGLDIPLFWKNIFKMAIIPGLMLVAGLLLNQIMVIDNWIIFFAGVILFTVAYAALMYRFAMNDYEKDIVRKPLQRIIRIVKRK